jgi:hypothetical protein
MRRSLAPGVLGLALLFVGCGDDRPPPAPRLDAGARGDADVRDAEALDGGIVEPPSDLGRRAVAPVLPSADIDVVLPFGAEAVEVPLAISADLTLLDVVFSIDTTGSFGGEIDALQQDVLSVVTPRLAARVDDVAFAVTRFEDLPIAPFGVATDRPFTLVTPITTSTALLASGVASLDSPLGNGGDWPESGAEALYQIATGDGFPPFVSPYAPSREPGGAARGGVGFREGSLRVVLHVTDAPTHEPAEYAGFARGAHSLAEATAALRANRVAVIGVASGDSARVHLETLATGTGATVAPGADGQCATGLGGATRSPVAGRCPLVFDIESDGTGLSTAVVDAVVALVDSVAYDEVWGEAVGDPLRFVRAVEARSATPPPGAPPPGRADRRPAGDGVLDTFTDVRAGTRVEVAAILRNETVRETDYDQVFRLSLELRSGTYVLRRLTVRVVVPGVRPSRPDAGPGGSDAGIAGDSGERSDPGEAGDAGSAVDGDAGDAPLPGDAG